MLLHLPHWARSYASCGTIGQAMLCHGALAIAFRGKGTSGFHMSTLDDPSIETGRSLVEPSGREKS